MKFLRPFWKKEDTADTEQERLAAYRISGDLALLGALYEPYMEMVFAICFKYLREEDESKDAVMQIFEKLITDLQKHEVVNLRSWLHTVARNHCLMHLRSVGGMVSSSDIFEDPADETPVYAELCEDHGAGSLQKCLDALSREQHDAVRLFYMEQKCYREIAEMTGYDAGKVKSYIQNGKRNLKICLEKNGSR